MSSKEPKGHVAIDHRAPFLFTTRSHFISDISQTNPNYFAWPRAAFLALLDHAVGGEVRSSASGLLAVLGRCRIRSLARSGRGHRRRRVG